MEEEAGRRFMERALELAAEGGGYVNPNPQVGAVVVKEGEVVGEGYHGEFGGPHAEVFALEDAGEAATGGTMFVTLEPCAHHGKTPPCVDRIIAAGLDRVYVALEDPNPKVSGIGIRKLRQAGIEVSVGLKEREARRLNEIYLKYVKSGHPFVLLKLAMTLDGKIATRSGDSRWISSEPARKVVHRLRARYSGVAVGVNTVLSDDPRLNVRKAEGPDGARFILDSEARTPGDARILNISSDSPTVVITGQDVGKERVAKIAETGTRVWQGPVGEAGVDLSWLLERMGDEGYDSLLVEGGGELAWSFLDQGLVDKIRFFYAPRIIGGRDAISGVSGTGRETVDEGIELAELELERVGDDISVVAYPEEG